jgi:hypothetical protein
MSNFIKLNKKYIRKDLIKEFFIQNGDQLVVIYNNENIIIVEFINDKDIYEMYQGPHDEYLLKLLDNKK